LELKEALEFKNDEMIKLYLKQFVHTLKLHSQENKNDYSGLNFNNYHQIRNHIYDKFCLDELSKIANINKFGFSKKFKKLTGMISMNYV